MGSSRAGTVTVTCGALAAAVCTLLAPRPEAQQGVMLERVTVKEVQALLGARGTTTLVNFWATWCPPCRDEFPDLVRLSREFARRPFQLVTVSINYPDEDASVRVFLERYRPTGRHLIAATGDAGDLARVFDPEWNGAIPFSVLIGPDGRVLHSALGVLEIARMRRLILASFEDG